MSVPSAIVWSMDDGLSGEARTRLARGTASNAVLRIPEGADAAPAAASAGSASDEPARSIGEAIERLVAAEIPAEIPAEMPAGLGAERADEGTDDAVAEWMQGGG